jgi:hypothetical protein
VLINPIIRTITRHSRHAYHRTRDNTTELCRQQAEVIQNHENEHVRRIGRGEARHRKYKRLKLGGGQAYECSSDKDKYERRDLLWKACTDRVPVRSAKARILTCYMCDTYT